MPRLHARSQRNPPASFTASCADCPQVLLCLAQLKLPHHPRSVKLTIEVQAEQSSGPGVVLSALPCSRREQPASTRGKEGRGREGEGTRSANVAGRKGLGAPDCLDRCHTRAQHTQLPPSSAPPGGHKCVTITTSSPPTDQRQCQQSKPASASTPRQHDVSCPATQRLGSRIHGAQDKPASTAQKAHCSKACGWPASRGWGQGRTRNRQRRVVMMAVCVQARVPRHAGIITTPTAHPGRTAKPFSTGGARANETE